MTRYASGLAERTLPSASPRTRIGYQEILT
jgi:hypothetical protein